MKKILSRIYVFLFFPLVKKKYSSLAILNTTETIKLIEQKKLSVCRFGDGEFKWMLNIKNKSFQKNDENLSRRLFEVYNSRNKNILICIPRAFKDASGNTSDSKTFWRKFLIRYNSKLKKCINPSYTYGNASFTRPYMPSRNKSKSGDIFCLVKTIWDNQKVLIVEGAGTKLGVGNSLLDNAKSIERIICPSVDAYSYYEEILLKAKELGRGKLVLCALGPTATVLAYDLAISGIRAIDIGHIDIEYEWFLRKTEKKEIIPGKAVNEVNLSNMTDSQISDDKYLEQTKAIIK